MTAAANRISTSGLKDNDRARPVPQPELPPSNPTAPHPPLSFDGERVARSHYGMVSSVEADATRVGVAVLERGGNAVDAAVAVGYALAVTHPSAGNLGGGGFLLVRFPGKATEAVDFREQAPSGANGDAFHRMLASGAKGPAASAVPGSVAGLNLAQRTWGRLPLKDVLQPAIELARDGHLLSAHAARIIAAARQDLEKDAAARAIFLPRGLPPKAGTRLIQRDLAATLTRIAADGDAGFYSGPSAEAIAALTEGSVHPISRADLAGYQAELREPLHAHYRGYQLDVAPPPSAGGVAVVQMLAMLEAEHAAELTRDSVAALHVFAEVAKRAHAERRFNVGDPRAETHEERNSLLARWADAQTWLGPYPIDRTHATAAGKLHPLYSAAVGELDHTTHYSVADSSGAVVSCTTTLSASFGARYVVPGIGVVMNNSLAAFSTVGKNQLAPGRRMTSSMTPALLLDGEGVAAALGSPGGDTIPNTVVQVLRNLIDYQLPLDQAVDAPRVHHGFVPDSLRYESARPPTRATQHGLRLLGHTLHHPSAWIGDANNLLLRGDEFIGYADPREQGLALGPMIAPAALSAPDPRK